MAREQQYHGILFCIISVLAVWVILALTMICLTGEPLERAFTGTAFFLPFHFPIPALALVLFLTGSEKRHRIAWVMLRVWALLTALSLIWIPFVLANDAQNALLYLFHPIYIALLTPILTGLYCVTKHIASCKRRR